MQAFLSCVIALSIDATAALQLTSRGGSRRDVLNAFAAAAPLFAVANSASAGTVGAAPVSGGHSTWDPPAHPPTHPSGCPVFRAVLVRHRKTRLSSTLSSRRSSRIRKRNLPRWATSLRKKTRRRHALAPLPTTHHKPLHAFFLDSVTDAVARARCPAARVLAADEPVRLPGQAQVQGVGETAQEQVASGRLSACLSVNIVCSTYAFDTHAFCTPSSHTRAEAQETAGGARQARGFDGLARAACGAAWGD